MNNERRQHAQYYQFEHWDCGVQRQHHWLDHGRGSHHTPGFPIVLGSAALGLNTALTDITLNTNFTAGSGFTAWMTAAAIGAATDTATVDLPGVTATAHLNVTTGSNGYESLTVDSGGMQP